MALKDGAGVWDDQRFIARCALAAKRKGWSLTMLCQKAGVADNYLGKSPAYGRNIASIIMIAKALEVPLEWLLEKPISNEDVAELSGTFVKEFVKNVIMANTGADGDHLNYDRLYKHIDVWLSKTASEMARNQADKYWELIDQDTCPANKCPLRRQQ